MSKPKSHFSDLGSISALLKDYPFTGVDFGSGEFTHPTQLKKTKPKLLSPDALKLLLRWREVASAVLGDSTTQIDVASDLFSKDPYAHQGMTCPSAPSEGWTSTAYVEQGLHWLVTLGVCCIEKYVDYYHSPHPQVAVDTWVYGADCRALAMAKGSTSAPDLAHHWLQLNTAFSVLGSLGPIQFSVVALSESSSRYKARVRFSLDLDQLEMHSKKWPTGGA